MQDSLQSPAGIVSLDEEEAEANAAAASGLAGAWQGSRFPLLFWLKHNWLPAANTSLPSHLTDNAAVRFAYPLSPFAGDEGDYDADPRAALLLQLLLTSLEQPPINFAQLLCGYDADAGGRAVPACSTCTPPPSCLCLLTHPLTHPSTVVTAGMGQVYLPDLRGQYNVLRVVLDAVQMPGLAARKPALFEQCLELLYELAARGWRRAACAP